MHMRRTHSKIKRKKISRRKKNSIESEYCVQSSMLIMRLNLNTSSECYTAIVLLFVGLAKEISNRSKYMLNEYASLFFLPTISAVYLFP